jgi:hypothetical protein
MRKKLYWFSSLFLTNLAFQIRMRLMDTPYIYSTLFTYPAMSSLLIQYAYIYLEIIHQLHIVLPEF